MGGGIIIVAIIIVDVILTGLGRLISLAGSHWGINIVIGISCLSFAYK
jgi:hypothetical protein